MQPAVRLRNEWQPAGARVPTFDASRALVLGQRNGVRVPLAAPEPRTPIPERRPAAAHYTAVASYDGGVSPRDNTCSRDGAARPEL